MRFKRHILLILLIIGFCANILNAQTYTKVTHTVKMGETAYSIATAYETTVEEIYKLNPESDKGIKAGQILTLPSSKVAPQQTYTTYESSSTKKHKIEPKETLFSVSQKYGITVSELLKANSGLDESSFSIGREIIIPNSTPQPETRLAPREITTNSLEHKVEKQETLYSISKKYNATIEDIVNANPIIRQEGLKEGSSIFIPQSGYTEFNSYNTSYARLDRNQPTYYLPEDGVVRVALLLPFIEGSKSVSQEKITEYYEGFLLAIQRMKERGLNAEIYTFDIGTDSDTRRLESILGTNELNSLNLVIGGVSEKQVQLISHFSQRTGIKYVVPFSNKNTGVEDNKNIFQVANSHSNLFPKITRGFVNRFRDCNIIFMSEMGSDKNKMDFVNELQKGLRNSNVAFRTAPTTASITDDLSAVIDKSKKNIIVPTSSSEASLKRALEAVDVLTRNQTDISLFGYPEWQTYINKTSKLHQQNTYIYSMFYLDTKHPDAQLFSDRYKRWYNKNLVISYPKFAHMGYDTGIVFLAALQKLGHDFSSRMPDLNTATLQSPLYFEPISVRGGYINNGVYFINFRPDGSIDKKEISKQ